MMLDIWQQLQSFMGRGGPVLWVILALLVLMWILMIERLLYLNLGFGPLQQQLLGRWQARSERHSWHARAMRSRWPACNGSVRWWPARAPCCPATIPPASTAW